MTSRRPTCTARPCLSQPGRLPHAGLYPSLQANPVVYRGYSFLLAFYQSHSKASPKRVSGLQRKCIKSVLAIDLEHPMIPITSCRAFSCACRPLVSQLCMPPSSMQVSEFQTALSASTSTYLDELASKCGCSTGEGLFHRSYMYHKGLSPELLRSDWRRL